LHQANVRTIASPTHGLNDGCGTGAAHTGVFVNHGLQADNYSSHCSMIQIVQSKDGNPSLGTVLKVINALGHGA
jgi:hypothetical protein